MAGLWEPVNGVYWSAAPLLPNLEWIGNLGGSSFFTTVFGALAGAFAGAWAAQRIAERSKLREEWQREIRSVNAGVVLTSATCNLAYALKKQHIKALKESYDAECKSMHEHKLAVAAGVPLGPFEFAPKLDSLHEISPPLDYLQDIVGRLSNSGRALAAVTAVADAIRNLNNALNKRNELLERMKDEKLPAGAEVHHFYFGIPYAVGRGNNEYGGYVQALASYTDDALFFSIKLHDDLYQHGKGIAEKYRKKFGGDVPCVSYIDWQKADSEGLLPKDEEYSDWLSGYEVLPKKELQWWQRKGKSVQVTK